MSQHYPTQRRVLRLIRAVDGLEFEPDDVNKANAFAAALKQTLRELIGLASIPASEHPVWEAWGSQSLLTLKVGSFCHVCVSVTHSRVSLGP